MTTKKEDSVLEAVFDSSLKTYGFTVSQVSVIIMLFLSTFGFSNLFNVGVWTLTTIFCFLVVHILRRYISSNVLFVLLFSVFFTLVILFCTLYIFHIYNFKEFLDISKFISENKNLSSAYFAILISIPIAFILISYQKQEAMFGMQYPKDIISAINRLHSLSFYRKNVVYKITVREIHRNKITIHTVLNYEIVNRTSDTKTWMMLFKYKKEKGKMLSAKFNNDELFLESKDYMVGRGLEIPIDLKSKDSGKVHYEAEEFFNFGQMELYTTYLPSNTLKVIIDNPFQEELLLDIEGLSNTPYIIINENDTIIAEIKNGVLSYQGIKINFVKKG